MYQSQWIQDRRSAWIAANGPCTRCGSGEDLEVDHVDPGRKTMEVRSIWSRRADVRRAELALCQVLCKNCHDQKCAEDGHPRIAQHGGARKYVAGCRCELCRKGESERSRRKREKKRSRLAP
jgi:hypothetical protein